MNKVKLDDIEKVLEPLFSYWNSTRQEGESFGSFTNRTVSGLRTLFLLLMLYALVI
jgi:sulfite reductase beta subunit-like hemoprotein